MKTTFLLLSSITIIFFVVVLSSCEKDEESLDGALLDDKSLVKALALPQDSISKGNATIEFLTSSKPTSRKDLGAMKKVVQIFDGEDNAGISVPGFGGMKLGKREKSVNLYYIETKLVIEGNDTTVYGIGYSAHYLFRKVKRGLDVTQLPSVAASVQIESNRTQVVYSLQSYGVISTILVGYFKPEVNANFDVDGFALIQKNIDGIHGVLSDSVLSKHVKFTPEVFRNIKPRELQL